MTVADNAAVLFLLKADVKIINALAESDGRQCKRSGHNRVRGINVL